MCLRRPSIPILPDLSIWVKDTLLESKDYAHVLRLQRAMKDVCFI